MSPHGPFTRMLNEALERRKAEASKRGGLQDFQIAMTVGINYAQLSNYKRGQLPRQKERVEALADALKVDRTEMLIAWEAQAGIHIGKHGELADALRQLVDIINQKTSLFRRLPPEILQHKDTSGRTMLQSLDELNLLVESVKQVFDWPPDDPWLSEDDSWMPDFEPVDVVDYVMGEGMVDTSKEAERLRSQEASRLAEVVPVSMLLKAAAIVMADKHDDAPGGVGRLLADVFELQYLVEALASSAGVSAKAVTIALDGLRTASRGI